MIDYRSTTPLYRQLYNAFKNAILSGEWKPNAKLPSVRALAAKYNLSKTTIEKAYNQLTIEGFIQSRPQSGTYVLPIKKTTMMISRSNTSYYEESTSHNTVQPLNTFDFSALKRALNDVIHDQSNALYAPPKPTGEPPLKEAIIHYLHQERSVKGNASQVIIGAGMQTHLTTLAKIIPKRKVGYLIPLFHHAENIFTLLNFTLVPCENLAELLKENLDFIYMSPSNLYPTGDVIPFNDRLRLIDYANQNNAYIIEDDYNYIYRHNAYQIPSIQSLSDERNVIYIGSFTRQLLPSFRLSYMVLPPRLLKQLKKTLPLTQTVSILDQLTMAAFMKRGAYQKHLKKLSAFSKKHNDKMRETLKPLNNHATLQYFGLNSNLHVLWQSKRTDIIHHLKEAFNEAQWAYTLIEAWPNTLLLPYNGFNDDDFNRLSNLINTLKSMASFSTK